jgi:hypothetical protein
LSDSNDRIEINFDKAVRPKEPETKLSLDGAARTQSRRAPQAFMTKREKKDHAALERKEKRLLTVLEREIKHLMMESMQGALSPQRTRALVDYLKLVKEFKKREEQELSKLPDEELEALATLKA